MGMVQCLWVRPTALALSCLSVIADMTCHQLEAVLVPVSPVQEAHVRMN